MWRYKNGLASSSSLGEETEMTLKNRGSNSRIIEEIRLPLPEAPQPSTKTRTGSF